MLNARAIATFGFGFSVAVIGALGLQDAQTTQPIVQAEAPQSAGGAGNDSGTGYVWKDNAWVKATKFAKIGVSNQYSVDPLSKAEVTATPAVFRLTAPPGDVVVAGSVAAHPATHLVQASRGATNMNSSATPNASRAIVSSYNGGCETLSVDELLILLEMAT